MLQRRVMFGVNCVGDHTVLHPLEEHSSNTANLMAAPMIRVSSTSCAQSHPGQIVSAFTN